MIDPSSKLDVCRAPGTQGAERNPSHLHPETARKRLTRRDALCRDSRQGARLLRFRPVVEPDVREPVPFLAWPKHLADSPTASQLDAVAPPARRARDFGRVPTAREIGNNNRDGRPDLRRYPGDSRPYRTA